MPHWFSTFVLAVSFSSIYSLQLWSITDPFNRKQIPEKFASKPHIPLMVLWSEIYWLSEDLDVIISCPSPFGEDSVQCLTSRNQSKLSDTRTSAVLMYGADLDAEKLPIPRQERHLWALLHDESPKGQPILMIDRFLQLFNYSAMFSEGSDLPLASISIYNYNYLVDRQPVHIDRKNRLIHKRRTKPVLYVQSLCLTYSDRDSYIKELMKYVEIDAYGDCLNNIKLPPRLRDSERHHESKAFYEFTARFKFHIAFENAVCDDYMSEKLFRTLHVGSVPIYFGSKKDLVLKWLPSDKSVIFASDFESAKDLGDYINYLNKNDSAYLEYLSYKDHFENQRLKLFLQKRQWENIPSNNDENKLKTVNYFPHFMCHMCKELHKRNRTGYSESSKRIPIKTVNSSHFRCQPPTPILGSLAAVSNESQRKYIEESRNHLKKLETFVDNLYSKIR